ncbi:hypothetical protein MRX96_010060 [Rhipicephalus microplus]
MRGEACKDTRRDLSRSLTDEPSSSFQPERDDLSEAFPERLCLEPVHPSAERRLRFCWRLQLEPNSSSHGRPLPPSIVHLINHRETTVP